MNERIINFVTITYTIHQVAYRAYREHDTK